MDLHLHLDGNGALQSQLLRALRVAIVERRLAPGARLPPSRQLAQSLGLSRNTVLHAFEQLAAEGFIHSRRGAGSFVQTDGVLPIASPPNTRADSAPRLSAYGMRLADCQNERLDGAPQRFDLSTGTVAVPPALQSAWRRALIRAADNTAFDYPAPAGLWELRLALAGYLARRRGIRADAEQILIVTGIQQGIDLAARLLLNPGESAIVEEPGYGGLRAALRAHGARVCLAEVDNDGLPISSLHKYPAAKLLVITPSHQFPTGAELPLARRLAILEWAQRAEAWVLEDDYDGEFRHGGRPLPALKSLDQGDRVIYLGSLSRVLFPAVRLGYLVLPPALCNPFVWAKRLADRGSPAIEQTALADLIASGRFERLLLASARQLDQRRLALIDAIRMNFAAAQFSGGSAGMHVCLRLGQFSASLEQTLVAAAARIGVRIEGISRYRESAFADPGAVIQAPARRPLELLLGYAHLSPEDLREAVRRLACVVSELAA